MDALRWLATAHANKELHDLVTVPNRPGRYKPRERKRPPKGPYNFLKQPRNKLRKAMATQGVTP